MLYVKTAKSYELADLLHMSQSLLNLWSGYVRLDVNQLDS